MYTNAGILAMLPPVDVGKNLVRIEKLLSKVEEEKLLVTGREFDELVRWEEDIRAHFVRKAEQMGLTNVRRPHMKMY